MKRKPTEYTSVRVTKKAHAALRKMSKRCGLSMGKTIEYLATGK